MPVTDGHIFKQESSAPAFDRNGNLFDPGPIDQAEDRDVQDGSDFIQGLWVLWLQWKHVYRVCDKAKPILEVASDVVDVPVLIAVAVRIRVLEQD